MGDLIEVLRFCSMETIVSYLSSSNISFLISSLLCFFTPYFSSCSIRVRTQTLDEVEPEASRGSRLHVAVRCGVSKLSTCNVWPVLVVVVVDPVDS